MCNYSEGSIPPDVLCERSSQKTREQRREIMQSMISVHCGACNCEGTEQLPRYSTLVFLRAKANRKPQLRIHKGNEHSMKLHILETNGQFFLPGRLAKSNK